MRPAGDRRRRHGRVDSEAAPRKSVTRELLTLIDWLEGARGPAALATVVRTSGSTYRKAGARLAVLEDGETRGSVSAGCLEQDVVEAAHRVLAGGAAELLSYDNGSREDIVWGLGLGCNGVVDVLVQLYGPVAAVYRGAAKRIGAGESVVLSTVVAARGPGAAPPVGTAFLAHGGRIATASGEIEPQSGRVLEGPSGPLAVRLSGGAELDLTVEVLEPPRRLVVLGADPDSVPLVRLAASCGFDVTLVDHRKTHACGERFPEADRIVLCRPEEIPRKVSLDRGTMVVIKNHNYLLDREALRHVLPSEAAYVGQMGPRSRMEALLADLDAEGVSVTEAQKRRLHAPVGLDLHAETAEQIAVSIVGELLAVAAGRTGASLRARGGEIHDRR